ncbi:MAG TPA: hypothetical protein VMG38_02995 [Trebonia sp.]|nr:hypothetical protein [Trebonia sp.]
MRYRLRSDGPWRKVLPGVYATTTGVMTDDQRQMAALLYAGKGAVLTGSAAVRRHRLTCPGLNEVQVLVPQGVHVASRDYVQILRTWRMPERTYSTNLIKFAPLPRAVGDAARAMQRPEHARAVVCEAVQKGTGCTLEDLVAELKAGPVAGSRLFRAALADLSHGIRSEAERDLKLLIDRTDLPTPIYNARLYLCDGTFLGMVDAWWPRAGVGAEVDSRQYHMGAGDYSATMARHNRIEGAGVHLFHFLPRDIRPLWPQLLATIRNAIIEGVRRPPLPIITVPAEVTDVRTFLLAKTAS